MTRDKKLLLIDQLLAKVKAMAFDLVQDGNVNISEMEFVLEALDMVNKGVTPVKGSLPIATVDRSTLYFEIDSEDEEGDRRCIHVYQEEVDD